MNDWDTSTAKKILDGVAAGEINPYDVMQSFLINLDEKDIAEIIDKSGLFHGFQTEGK